jgi:hypothetical protein
VIMKRNVAQARTKTLFCTAYANFVSNPRRIHSGEKDRERDKEKGRERGIWVVVCCYLLCTAPPPPPPPLPHPGHHFTCPGPWLSGLEALGRAPPPIPLPLLDSLRLQQQISRIASNSEVISMTADIGQQ